MNKSSLVLVALLLSTPVLADNTPTTANQPLTLASLDVSNTAKTQTLSETSDLAARLDEEVKEVSKTLSAKIDAELSATINKEGSEKVKF